jgi:signal transduction histidine kinase
MTPETENYPIQSPERREYLQGMLAFERRAVIPLKWLILSVSAYFLVILGKPPYRLPEIGPFMLFLVYFLFNLAQSYFFYFREIYIRQVRSFVLTSYAVDLLFITSLLYMDGRHAFGPETHSDLYAFYFLVILRGAATFRSTRGKLLMNIILSAVFVLAVWGAFGRSLSNPLHGHDFAMKLTMIWMVMLVSWFIVDLLNRQAEQLVRVRERLLQSEHLASIGELAAGVAHEINNPVGIIVANCEYLLRAMPTEGQGREDIEAVLTEAERVKGIVGRMMDFAKPYDETPSACDVREINEAVVAFLFGKKRYPDIDFEVHYDSRLPRVLGDPNQIKQALLNIYLNARQAIDENGRIEARLERLAAGKLLAITVADDGPGIGEEALPRVFEPFFTSRPGGTGLGLSVTQRIIESLGGEIALENRRPRGARARVVLPAAGEPRR